MATIYKVEMSIVSEFCSYTEQQLTQRFIEMVKNWRDKDSKLGLLVYDPKVTIIK